MPKQKEILAPDLAGTPWPPKPEGYVPPPPPREFSLDTVLGLARECIPTLRWYEKNAGGEYGPQAKRLADALEFQFSAIDVARTPPA